MAKEFLTGNEAFAHAALEAGVRVCAGYPGTPSSEVIETVAKEHAAGRAEGVHVEWSTNEKAALELLAGAAYSGARTLYTCKQVGLNVASDALMSLNYVGVKGGTVLYVADDPGPIPIDSLPEPLMSSHPHSTGAPPQKRSIATRLPQVQKTIFPPMPPSSTAAAAP